MASMSGLTIGQLAEQGRVNVQTIRYYERRGLLPQAKRASSGYRIYDAGAVQRLSFIRRAQRLGFSLLEIEDLLSLRVHPGTTCADIQAKARAKIAAVDAKIEELTRIRSALVVLATRCRGRGPTSKCAILEALDAAGGAANAS